jgi:serine/threonine protein kinase
MPEGSPGRPGRARKAKRVPGFIGISLRRRLKTLGALSLAEAALLFDLLAETIAGVHRERSRHGYICPENIWLMPDGSIRVFRPVRDARAEWKAHMARLGYASPEETAGEKPTRAADVWALGNLLFDVLAGTAAPDNGPRTGEMLKTIGAVVGAAAPVVDGATKRALEGRYPTVQAMATALRAVVPQKAPAVRPAALPPLVGPAPLPRVAIASPSLPPARAGALPPPLPPAGLARQEMLRPIGSDPSVSGEDGQPAAPNRVPPPLAPPGRDGG